MKKLKYGLVLMLILALSGYLIITYKNNHTMKYSYGIPGMVIKKEVIEKKYFYIYLKVVAVNDKTEVKRIKVKDENVWNLIENKRTYYTIFSYKENETPVLDLIKIDNDFGIVYKDILQQK